MILLLMTSALLCWKKGLPVITGALLGLAAIVKLPLALFGFYFLIRRRWRAAAGFFATVSGIATLSVIVHGIMMHQVWLQKCVVSYIGKPIAGFNVQSLYGFLARLYGGDVLDWRPLIIGGSYPVVRILFTAILLCTAGFVLWRSGSPRDFPGAVLEFSVVLLLLLLLSPISWSHYYLWLLLPQAFWIKGDISLPPGRWWLMLAAVALLAVMIPVRTLHPRNPLLCAIADRVLISHYFFGGLIFLAILLRSRWAYRLIPPPA
jgi:hypothetical protein